MKLPYTSTQPIGGVVMSQTKNSNEQIATIIQQAKDLGLSYKEAADRFGLPVWKIYEYNKAQKKTHQLTRHKKKQNNHPHRPRRSIDHKITRPMVFRTR
jgi:hypothetical protein